MDALLVIGAISFGLAGRRIMDRPSWASTPAGQTYLSIAGFLVAASCGVYVICNLHAILPRSVRMAA